MTDTPISEPTHTIPANFYALGARLDHDTMMQLAGYSTIGNPDIPDVLEVNGRAHVIELLDNDQE